MGHENGQPDSTTHGKMSHNANQGNDDVNIHTWRAALLQVQQAQALVDAPLSAGHPIPPRPNMREGLLYGLHNLLAPMDSVMQMQVTSVQRLAAAITADPAANTTPTQGLLAFAQSASSMLSMAEQVKRLLHERLSVSENTGNAFSVLEQEMERAPLKRGDERDIVLRMRKKRRHLTDAVFTSESVEGKSMKDGAPLRSPLQPMPKSLTFEATTSWVDDVVERSEQASTSGAINDLLNAFQIYINERCKQEALILTDAQNTHPLPALRVRARLAKWCETSGSVEVELRDIGLVSIQVQVIESDVQITSVRMCAPTEYKHISTNSLLPSRFTFYDDMSNHLFVYAVSHERKNGRGIEALGLTLLHVAGLRTLYDPLPILATNVAPMISRVMYGTLGWNATIDREQCIVWKWCQVVAGTPSPHGEWCAYAPSLL